MTTQPPKATTAQKALTIQPKTAAGGIASYLAIVVLYTLNAVWDITPPAEVAVAITGIVAFAVAWAAPPRSVPDTPTE